MFNKILSLTKKLISVRSTDDNPKGLTEIMALAKNEVKEYHLEEFVKDGIPSFLAYNTKTRPRKFKMLFNAHLDVVSAKEGQYIPKEKNDRLYGRGAFDMKGAAVAEILAFKEMAKKLTVPIGLQIVTDEEIGGFNGTKYQVEQGVRSDFVLVGEQTNFDIGNEAKGIIWIKYTVFGKTAHGAYPWQGDNAIIKANKILDKIRTQYPVPKKAVWETTVNVAQIESTNKTFNKVADDCSIFCDIRYVPSDAKNILTKLRKFAPPESKITISENEPVHFTEKNNPYIKLIQEVSKKIIKKVPKVIRKNGASDLRHYDEVGCSGVEFGPIGYGLHTDNEWVDMKSLNDYYLILKELLYLCGKP